MLIFVGTFAAGFTGAFAGTLLGMYLGGSMVARGVKDVFKL